jgi:hypothetical protein
MPVEIIDVAGQWLQIKFEECLSRPIMNDHPDGERSDRPGVKNHGADLRLRHRSRGLVWGHGHPLRQVL